MPRLIVKNKAEVLSELSLKPGKKHYKIGADDDNDLVLDDKRVSMAHARIVREGDHYVIEDMKSAFGTVVNGKKIARKTTLRNGDEIRIGDQLIVFDNVLEFVEAPGPDRDKKTPGAPLDSGRHQEAEVVLQEVETIPASTIDAPEPEKNGRDEMAPYYLLAIYGPYSGKRFQLKYGETRIGRDTKLNDIVIRENARGEIDPSISRRHATVVYNGHGFVVTDKRSKTRTFVNQNMVPEDDEIGLRPGDEIEIVSDQKSSIFRFVAEGNWDYTSARKAGIWLVRYRSRFLAGLSAVALIGGIALMIAGWSQYTMIEQRPQPFELNEVKWRQTGAGAPQLAGRESFLPDVKTRPRPALADFTGDGHVDLALLNINRNATVVDGVTRRTMWTLAAHTMDAGAQLVAEDLNRNGASDLIALTTNGQIVAIDGALGAEIWISPFFNKPFSGPPVIADLNGDGNMDVAVAEQGGTVHIGMANAINTLEWASVDLGLIMQAPIAAADLDGNGADELLCATERGLVLAIDGVSRNIAATIDVNSELSKAQGSFLGENQIRSPVGVADLTGDGRPDMAISSLQGYIMVIDGSTRQRLWHAEVSQGLTMTPGFPFPLALGDLTGDGLADLVVATESGLLMAFVGHGDHMAPKALWTFMPENGAAVMQGFALADMNKDRVADIVYIDLNGVLYIVNGQSGKMLWQAAEPIAERTSGPLVADLGKDETLDLMLLSENGRVVQFATNSRVPVSSIIWGQYYGQSRNTLSSSFRMPESTYALFSMLLGGILLLGTATTVIINKFRRRQPL